MYVQTHSGWGRYVHIRLYVLKDQQKYFLEERDFGFLADSGVEARSGHFEGGLGKPLMRRELELTCEKWSSGVRRAISSK